MHFFCVGGGFSLVAGYLTCALTSWSFRLGGLLYATVGVLGKISFTGGDDIKIGQCLHIIWVMLGIPVPYVVIRGIGMIVSSLTFLSICNNVCLSKSLTSLKASSNSLCNNVCLSKSLTLLKASSILWVNNITEFFVLY